MPGQSTSPVDPRPSHRERSRRRRLVRVFAGIVIGVLAITAATKYWIAPGILRRAVRQNLPRYWQGRLDIEDAAVSFGGRVRLSGLTLLDDSGRVWARLGSATLGLDRWPGSSPVLATADLERLTIEAHVVAGRCEPPVRNLPDLLRWLRERTQIRRITIEDGAVRIHPQPLEPGTEGPGGPAETSNRHSLLWNGIRFTCFRDRSGSNYHFKLTRSPSGPAGASCHGTIDCDGTIVRRPDRSVAYAGNIRLKNVDGAEAVASVGLEPPAQLGTIDFSYHFAGEGLCPPVVAGYGELQLGPPFPPFTWWARAAFSSAGSFLAILGSAWPAGPGRILFERAPSPLAVPRTSRQE